MNKLIIIGNLTREPETNTTNNGKTVCNFTVAVNRKNKIEGQPEADFFRVAAWGKTGEICQNYLTKGRKVCVVGSVSSRAFLDKENNPKSSLDVFAESVEFLSPANNGDGQKETAQAPSAGGFTAVETDEMPF